MKAILYSYATVLLLAGCHNVNLPSNENLAIPLQATRQQELMLIELEKLLALPKLNEETRTVLLYERGCIYDSLGLYVLASNDFTQALSLRANIPNAFASLGNYLMLEDNFNIAYEAYDAALELDPNDSHIYLARGIAFYYDAHYALAHADFLEYYRINPNDPAATLWLYFSELEQPKFAAAQNLRQRYQKADKQNDRWKIVTFYLNTKKTDDLLAKLPEKITDNRLLAEYLSDIDFYLGKYYLSQGEKDQATLFFKLALANNVYTADTHRYALLELTRLNQKLSR